MGRLPRLLLLAVALFVAFVAGAWIHHRSTSAKSANAGREVLYWHDPMHPEYRSDKPGIAPDCGMQLEPVYADGLPAETDRLQSLPFGTVKVSAEKQQLIGVRLGEVQPASGLQHQRTVGRVLPDERRVFRINTAAPGWLRETYSHTVGGLVRRGEALLAFSPLDLAPQQAYLSALINSRRYNENNSNEQQLTTVRSQVEVAAAALRSIGMSDAQVSELARTRRLADRIILRSPANGVLLARNVTAGQRFDANDELLVVADLQRVWVLADVFQYETRHLRPGQVATVTLPQQQRTFEARVSEVPPQFDENSRTLKVRLELDNPDLVLRPGMFVDVELPLNLPPALTVSADAVLDSGTKKTVFVDRGEGYFEPRRVETGWRLGDRVQIVRGLEAGERVVTSGTFLIDAESRLKAAVAGMRGEPVKDVVCGMDVDESRSNATGKVSNYEGKTFHFCSSACKEKFDAAPGRYVTAAEKGEAEPSPPHPQHDTHVTAPAPLPEPQARAALHPAPASMPRVKKAAAHEVMSPALRAATRAPQAGPAKDPVCGMDVGEDQAKAAGKVSTHEGKPFYFCSTACKQKFDADPQRYVSEKSGHPTSHPAESHDVKDDSPEPPAAEAHIHD